MTVRVWVPEVWDIVSLDAGPEWSVARLKSEALERATGRAPDGEAYEVKFRGALVLDESATLSALGAPDNASFIVLHARRLPAK
jgi:hypothetical protein